MRRDPGLDERVLWEGRPGVVELPGALRIAAGTLAALAVISLCFAVVVALGLGERPVGPFLFAAWAAALSLGVARWPALWATGLRYLVTERHVVVERGPFRRTIERAAVSFARIRWSRAHPGFGDLELVRAVPAGALRRRLRVELRGVPSPDLLWAVVRGVEQTAAPPSGDRPLAQRLDPGERVVCATQPRRQRRALPRGRRALSVLALSLALFGVTFEMVRRSVPSLSGLLAAGLARTPLAALVAAEGLSLLLLLAVAVGLAVDSLVLPLLRMDGTRYLITDRRVLIQRGREELHLDRSHIADVIPAPSAVGNTDVFLVLDGPRARAMSTGGAFGDDDGGTGLRPVLEAVEDPEAVSRALLGDGTRRAPRAA